ncbi:MAG: hypothetical protein SYC29_01070 [Planctomycetota bacterium]|nr:hypothetical protein [Planctomycetota bacterium]
MRFYRVIRAINRAYALTVLWLYIAAFLVAVALMFMYPIGTITLVWAGLVGLVVALLVGRLLAIVQRALARRSLTASRCPSCGAGLDDVSAEASSPRTCGACGCIFLPNGAEQTGSGEPETTRAAEE